MRGYAFPAGWPEFLPGLQVSAWQLAPGALRGRGRRRAEAGGQARARACKPNRSHRGLKGRTKGRPSPRARRPIRKVPIPPSSSNSSEQTSRPSAPPPAGGYSGPKTATRSSPPRGGRSGRKSGRLSRAAGQPTGLDQAAPVARHITELITKCRYWGGHCCCRGVQGACEPPTPSRPAVIRIRTHRETRLRRERKFKSLTKTNARKQAILKRCGRAAPQGVAYPGGGCETQIRAARR